MENNTNRGLPCYIAEVLCLPNIPAEDPIRQLQETLVKYEGFQERLADQNC